MDHTPNASWGRVFLVGAGPGDPGLLTLRAVECLRQADLVFYDQLVPLRLLEHAPAHAERRCVGDLPGPHPGRCLQIQELLIQEAQAGKTVVRLKGGDPWIFGRGGEEAAALRQAGVAYEVVPGVTAALAAGACAAIPLTHRDLSSAVALVTGHECSKENSALDWHALARFPGTLVVYMGLKRLPQIAATLIAQGKPAVTPIAVVQWAGTNQQRTVTGTLATIAERVKDAELVSPAIAIVGTVVAVRETLAWFESRPLFGRRVVVTRPRRQVDAMVRQLETLGATVHSMPLIAIGPAPDLGAVDQALARLAEFDWLVFTSANGVQAFLDRLLTTGQDLRAFGGLKIAAIGPRTAEVLRAFHLRPDLVPPTFNSETLVATLLPQVQGLRVLLARADRGRELLREELLRVAHVEQIAVYTQMDRVEGDPEVMELLRAGKIDYVTLTSPNIALNFLNLLDEPSRAHLGHAVQLVAISPLTGSKVREMGFAVAAEAEEYTAEGIVRALVTLACQRSSRSVSMPT